MKRHASDVIEDASEGGRATVRGGARAASEGCLIRRHVVADDFASRASAVMTPVPGEPTLERSLLRIARVIAPSRRDASLRVRAHPRDIARKYSPQTSSRRRREGGDADADVPRRVVFIQFPERRRYPPRAPSPTTTRSSVRVTIPSPTLSRRPDHRSRRRARRRARRAHARRARRAADERDPAPDAEHQPETLRRPRHRRERRARAHHRSHRAFPKRARLVGRHASTRRVRLSVGAF